MIERIPFYIFYAVFLISFICLAIYAGEVQKRNAKPNVAYPNGWGSPESAMYYLDSGEAFYEGEGIYCFTDNTEIYCQTERGLDYE